MSNSWQNMNVYFTALILTLSIYLVFHSTLSEKVNTAPLWEFCIFWVPDLVHPHTWCDGGMWLWKSRFWNFDDKGRRCSPLIYVNPVHSHSYIFPACHAWLKNCWGTDISILSHMTVTLCSSTAVTHTNTCDYEISIIWRHKIISEYICILYSAIIIWNALKDSNARQPITLSKSSTA